MPGGIITTGNHPKLLWPGIAAIWGLTYDQHPTEWTDLYDQKTSEKAYEEDLQSTGFGLAVIKRQGTGVHYATHAQGFITRSVHVAYALGYIVTHEELQDNQYKEVASKRAEANAFSMRQTKERVAALIYNRAFDSNYVGGDAVCMCSASHPSKAGLWSNALTPAADISEMALEDMCVMVYGATNDLGHQINLVPQSLHVHWSNWFEANRILKSVNQNDTANNAINVLRSTGVFPGGIKLNHYFSDADAFFVRTNIPRGMIAWDRESIPLKQDNDFDTMNAKAFAYERYSFNWTDPRGVYGSEGA